MKRIKRFFNRLAIMVVTAYGNRIYRKAVKAADERHAQEKETIYVSYFGRELRTFNRAEFRYAKKKIGASRNYNMTAFRNAACYYTADRSGKNGMSPRDKELRRLAFIKFLLINAKLV
jgi:hypothetical protein